MAQEKLVDILGPRTGRPLPFEPLAPQAPAEEEATPVQVVGPLPVPTSPAHTRNLPNFVVRRVRVETAGTPVQGPDIAVPDGFALTVRMRRKTSSSPTGYLSNSRTGVGDDTSRHVLAENDAVTYRVTNMNVIWVDADEDQVDFEFFVEQE